MSVLNPHARPMSRRRSESRPGMTAAAQRGSVTQAGTLAWPVRLYLLVILFPIVFHLGPIYMTGVRVVTVVMILPLLFRLFTGRLGRVLFADIFFMLHLAWAAVALQVNNPAQMITQIGSVGPEFLGGYLIARAYVRSRADFLALCRALMYMVLFSLPFALYEARTGNPLIITTLSRLPGIVNLGNVNIEPRLGLQRVQGFMTHPIHYGLFCSSAISLVFLALKDSLSTSRRIAATGGIMLCTFLSLSSGALLPMLMQIFLTLWAVAFDRTGRPWLILLVMTTLAYVTVDLISDRTPIRVFFSYATFSSHNAYWRGIIFDWGMRNVWANPVFGIGLNDWVRPSFMHSGSMDNFWLVMAVRYGIIGFLTVAAGYGFLLFQVGRRNFAADPELARLRRAWMFVFAGLTFTLCTVHIWTNIYSFVFFLLGSGAWLVLSQPRTNDHHDDVGIETSQEPAGLRYSRFSPTHARS
jgi:hypothetical protein